MDGQSHGVGIDAGTTYTAACIDGNPIKLDYGGFNVARTGVVVYGENDWQLWSPEAIAPNGPPILRLVKRIIGRPPEDGKLKDDLRGIPFAQLSENGARLEVQGNTVAPEEVTGFVFGKIKAAIHRKVTKLERVFLAMPAYFTFQQRQATMDAAYVGGFDTAIIQPIEEPIAVVVDFMKSHFEYDKCTAVVWDVGGGTVDATLVYVERTADGGFVNNVLGTAGNTRLGGADIDMAIFELVKKKAGSSVLEEVGLLQQCEAAKRELSNGRLNVNIRLSSSTVEVTKDEFERASQLTVDAMIKVFEDLLEERQDAKDADVVISVGGSCCMPSIRDICRKIEGAKHFDIPDPELAVARGASIAASNPNIVIKTVLPRSIGIECYDTESQAMHNCILVTRNTALPYPTRHILYVHKEDQRSLEFSILEGESKEVCETTPVGTFAFQLGKGVPVGAEITVLICINKPGDLTVKASVGDSEGSIVIEPTPRASQAQLRMWRDKTRLRAMGLAQEAPNSEAEETEVGSFIRSPSHPPPGMVREVCAADNTQIEESAASSTSVQASNNRAGDTGRTNPQIGELCVPSNEPCTRGSAIEGLGEEPGKEQAVDKAENETPWGVVGSDAVSNQASPSSPIASGCRKAASPGDVVAPNPSHNGDAETQAQVLSVAELKKDDGLGIIDSKVETLGMPDDGGSEPQTQRLSPVDGSGTQSSVERSVCSPTENESYEQSPGKYTWSRFSLSTGSGVQLARPNQDGTSGSQARGDGDSGPSEERIEGEPAEQENTSMGDTAIEDVGREAAGSKRVTGQDKSSKFAQLRPVNTHAIAEQRQGRPWSPEQYSLSDEVIRIVSDARKIFVLVGAGISTSAGMPVCIAYGVALPFANANKEAGFSR